VVDLRVGLREQFDGAHLAAYLKRIVLPVGVLLLAMIGLGRVVTAVFADENTINRRFVAHTSGTLDVISNVFSLIGSTPCIIAATGVAAFILWRALRRWSEPLFLSFAVTAQAIVFFFTTLAIDRERPAVRHLDDSPPTSSFPSGHTSAAVALYGGLALVLSVLLRQTWAKWTVWLLVLVPVGVAVARLYRGMHHPTDVVASFLNGGLCITIMALAFLWGGIRSEVRN
jgi:membrane-associated phospholipid phosphatase